LEEGMTTFNGVMWRRTPDGVSFVHAAAGIERWRERWSAEAASARKSCRWWAGIVGVLFWHWSVGGEILGAIAETRDIAHETTSGGSGAGGLEWVGGTVRCGGGVPDEPMEEPVQKRGAHMVPNVAY
jgi:hypothetical protein